jgi:predicted glycosyl hydrolase (DUF1957 family)
MKAMPDQLTKKGSKYVFVHSHSIVKALVMPSQKLIQPLLASELGSILGCFVVTNRKVVLGKGSSSKCNSNSSCPFFLCFEVA